MHPIIGITVDNRDNTAASGVYESAIPYSACVAKAGGVPVLLPHEVELVPHYINLCDGFLITGGADPRMDLLRGEPMHPKAKAVDERRQAFEWALLEALDALPQRPVLAICFGMQLMTLHAGGQIDQHLEDKLGEAAQVHRNRNRHPVEFVVKDAPIAGDGAAACTVVSAHHQGMTDAGRLRVIAKALDGVIEAVDDPQRKFYVGVQWHPERGGEGALNQSLIDRLVSSCRRAT